MAQKTQTLLYFPPPHPQQKPTFEQKDTNRIGSKKEKEKGEKEKREKSAIRIHRRGILAIREGGCEK